MKQVRKCNKCVYFELPTQDQPCKDCFEDPAHPAFQPLDENKYNCAVCAHRRQTIDSMVCKSCFEAGRPIHFSPVDNPTPWVPSQESKQDDPINHPAHYTRPGVIENWDGQELMLTEEEFVGAMKYNINKYVGRAGHKDPAKLLVDLGKARAYLDRWIRFARGERIVWARGHKNKDGET